MGYRNSPLRQIVESHGDETIERETPFEMSFLHEQAIDFIVSYGYRHIIGEQVVEYMRGKVINLHISLLPWNRGADPNLWSFFENTPKGVTIHFVDEGIDTGDVIVQKRLRFKEEEHTLASTYRILNKEIIELFRCIYPVLGKDQCPRKKQPIGGSYHKSIDKEKFMHLMTNGWQTPVSMISGKAQ